MISKFLDPKNDVAFKKIFGTEKNKDILIHFLNDMIEFKERVPIKEVTFLKPIQDPEIAAKKTSIVDILCKDENNNQYIVEMQVAKTKGFAKRAQYYAAKAYGSQINVGEEYENLKEVIFIAITDFDIFPEKKKWKCDHIILDKETFEHDLQDFSFTFLILPKFDDDIDHLETITQKWMYYFKHAEGTSEEDLKKIIGSDLIIERAYEELDRFYWNEEELCTYEQAEKRERDYFSSLAQKYDEGLEKGRKEGREEGIETGIEKGQLGKALEIAKSMLAKGMDVELVSSITGLSIEEVKSLTH